MTRHPHIHLAKITGEILRQFLEGTIDFEELGKTLRQLRQVSQKIDRIFTSLDLIKENFDSIPADSSISEVIHPHLSISKMVEESIGKFKEGLIKFDEFCEQMERLQEVAEKTVDIFVCLYRVQKSRVVSSSTESALSAEISSDSAESLFFANQLRLMLAQIDELVQADSKGELNKAVAKGRIGAIKVYWSHIVQELVRLEERAI